MWMQISSGRGPVECCLAVNHFYKHITNELREAGYDFKVLDTEPGGCNNTYKSVLLAIHNPEELSIESKYNGTILWICKSPYRIKHERKNWFFNCEVYRAPEPDEMDITNIKVETMRSSGNGGQNINKIESAVRITHIPTGITVTAREERSQALNRKLALARLRSILKGLEQKSEKLIQHDLWMQHNRLVRGNPIQVFEGREFKLSVNLERNMK